MDKIINRGKKILLLDVYKSRRRPLILPYFYLGAFFDFYGIDYHLYRWREDPEELQNVVQEHRIKYVFINAIMGQILTSLPQICNEIKAYNKDLKIWVGGTAVRFIPEALSADGNIDHVSTAFPNLDQQEFLNELKKTGVIDSIPVIYKRYPLLINNKFLPKFMHKHLYQDEFINAVALCSGGGCLNNCSFCYLNSYPVWQYPVNDLVEDIHQLYSQHQVKYYEFNDDNFLNNHANLKEFAKQLKQNELDILFFCLASVNTITPRNIELAYSAGLRKIYIGIETINPNLQKVYNKVFSMKAMNKAIELLRQYPIDITLSLVIGGPGETNKSFQQLYQWIKDINPEGCVPFYLVPYPGTDIYNKALQAGFKAPKTIEEWGKLMSDHEKQLIFNKNLSLEEYEVWRKTLRAISSGECRSGIGISYNRTIYTDDLQTIKP